MASASASIALSLTSSTGWPSARRSTGRSRSCRPTSILGFSTTTSSDLIKAVGASARLRWRPSLTLSLWQRRRSWPRDRRRYTGLNQPTASVRPGLDYYSLPERADHSAPFGALPRGLISLVGSGRADRHRQWL